MHFPFLGSTVLIRRVVTATTTQAYHENEVPKVEVHISPATETVISPPMSPNHQLNTQSHQQQTNSSSQMNSMSQYEQVTTTSYNHDNRYEMRTDHQYNEDNDERVSVRGKNMFASHSLPEYHLLRMVITMRYACNMFVRFLHMF